MPRYPYLFYGTSIANRSLAMKRLPFLALILILFLLPIYAAALPYIIVRFPPGETQLTKETKREIKHAVKKAQQKGILLGVSSAIWSDEELPIAPARLSKTERALAAAREQALTNYLQKHLRLHFTIDTFNMAEHDNSLARLYYSAKTDIIKAAKKWSDVSLEEFSLFQEKGGPSDAVLVLRSREFESKIASSPYEKTSYNSKYPQ